MKCEIEFLPVGAASKPGDAIVIRYGEPDAYWLMILDGGTLESGEALVSHIRSEFGAQAQIADVVLTHSDIDHASGLRAVLEQLPVTNLWLHVPWEHAAAARPYFADKTLTDAKLAAAIKKEYSIVDELVQLALKKRVTIYEPFAGDTIGPFRVLSPHRAVYDLFLPQFDKTPEPDQAAIEAQGGWIGKSPPTSLGRMFERVVAKVQKWVPESWLGERLKDGGVTSATNETSTVLYGSFEKGPALLTGDAGIWALTLAANRADRSELPLQSFAFVQIPHHGSRRNVGPTILNRLLGPIQAQSDPSRFSAFVSAPAEDDTHPRKMVLNAFMRRGGTVSATQGRKLVHWGGFPPRPNYVGATALGFSSQVEDYD